MFSNGKSTPQNQTRNQPVINMLSEGTVVNGTIVAKSDFRVSGTVNGDLKVEGKLILSKSGLIKGQIEAQEVDIAGIVEGSAVLADKLTIRQSGHVKSDIRTRVLLIEEGARFEGNCSMAATAKESKQPKVTPGIFNVAAARA